MPSTWLAAATIGVSMAPACTELQRMWYLFIWQCTAMLLVIARTAPLAALYAKNTGYPRCEATELMPQRFGLYEDLSVIENLSLYADLRGLPAEERDASFTRLLQFTDLERFRTRLAGNLSGGMSAARYLPLA